MDEDLIKYLEDIRKKNAPPAKKIEKYLKYYNGSQHDDQDNEKLKNAYNIIKPIIETKVTLVCKAQVTDAVVATTKSLNSIKEISVADKLAASVDDIRRDIWKDNLEKTFDEKSLRTAAIKGGCVGRVSWDNELINGLGQVKIDTLDPALCSWDGSVSKISDSNYFFHAPKVSIMDIKKKFAVDANGMVNTKVMEQLSQVGSDTNSEFSRDMSGNEDSEITNYEFGDSGGQVFAYNSPGKTTTTKKVTIIECYLRDDTVFYEEVNNEETKEKQKIWKLKYPTGRKITYICEENIKIKLEDEALDPNIGYPIDVFEWIPNEEEGHKFRGVSEVKDLIYIQDRINKLAARRTFLIQQHQRYLAFDSGYLKLSLNDFGDNPILLAKGLGDNPNAVQTYLIDGIADAVALKEVMEEYRAEALSIARLSDTILSGVHEPGVRSGKQVQELKQSPLNTIESIQQRYYEFKRSLTLKALKMAQYYYDVPRTIRISGSDTIINLPTQKDLEDTETGKIVNQEQSPITIARKTKDKNMQPREGEEISPDGQYVLEKIKSDLRLFDFDIELISGAAQARSPQENSDLTLMLLELGVFDNKYGVETTRMVLRNTDFPNRAAIMTEIENKAKEQEQYNKETPVFKKLLEGADPALLKGIGEIINSLKLNSKSKAEFLSKGLGFTETRVDTLAEAPAQEVMSKGDPEKIATISAAPVSTIPEEAAIGQAKAEDMILLEENAKNSNAVKK